MTVRQILRSAAARAARSPDPARVQRARSCEVSPCVRTFALVTSRLHTAIAAARFCGLAGVADVVPVVAVLEELDADAERLRVVLRLVLVVLVVLAPALGAVVVLVVVLALEALVTLALAVLVAVEPAPPPPQPLASAAPSARTAISNRRFPVTAGM
jgi:hypothetical protein